MQPGRLIRDCAMEGRRRRSECESARSDDEFISWEVDVSIGRISPPGARLLRYNSARTEDGLPPGEGAFLACTFWLADAYVLLGRMDDARRLFENVLAIANDVGLLAEEYDPRLRRMVGNFPQAFSHVALINTAHNLAYATKPAAQRAT